MFSFHKPKVYRSTQGCCICKAKSSSSRFTDSLKYENDFIECFQLATPRKGEICNACVLLVKRYKRLPPGSNRHWGHVVDARVGPGLKSMSKFKKRKEEQLMQQQNGNGKITAQPSTSHNSKTTTLVSERFGKIFKKNKKKVIVNTVKRDGSPGSSDDNSSPSSPVSAHSDLDEAKLNDHQYDEYDRYALKIGNGKKCGRKNSRPQKNRQIIQASFIEDEFWQQITTCCGFAYENQRYGAVVLVDSCVSECKFHKKLSENPSNNLKTDTKFPPLANSNIIAHHVINKASGLTKNDQNPMNDLLMNNNRSNSIEVPALKKHQIFGKWQNENANKIDAPKTITNKIDNNLIVNNCIITNKRIEIEQPNQMMEINDIGIAGPSSITVNHQMLDPIHLQSIKNNYKLSKLVSTNDPTKSTNYLHKIKSDSSKVVKHSLNKITPAKLKNSEIVKNLVKLCTEKTAKVMPTIERSTIVIGPNGNDKIIEALGSKFNENSSDSGYEEITQETSLKGRLSTIRPVILSNGIKLHVQPQNLVLAANLAGVTQIPHKPTQNHIIKIHQKDAIQNGVISSTTSTLDAIALVAQQQQQQQHQQQLQQPQQQQQQQPLLINKQQLTNQTKTGNLNQKVHSLNSSYFQQATN